MKEGRADSGGRNLPPWLGRIKFLPALMVLLHPRFLHGLPPSHSSTHNMSPTAAPNVHPTSPNHRKFTKQESVKAKATATASHLATPDPTYSSSQIVSLEEKYGAHNRQQSPVVPLVSRLDRPAFGVKRVGRFSGIAIGGVEVVRI
ncbi:hypothetical protein P691DRAFT_462440 [Macrolepiota fuliginosa MF-IS2]|uniref:Uncharacterized protein n=1 Tax=Macrolepiota fuliginosa MF-IS2 TaxID=1400762 RepID=A0A9P6C6P1_9AGAR|nr:hypothetical protein P691DRAFT_462440 [Macrolepiota fuliginosa MF-IS2]